MRRRGCFGGNDDDPVVDDDNDPFRWIRFAGVGGGGTPLFVSIFLMGLFHFLVDVDGGLGADGIWNCGNAVVVTDGGRRFF